MMLDEISTIIKDIHDSNTIKYLIITQKPDNRQ